MPTDNISYLKYPTSVTISERHTRVYPKVSGLVAWSENCRWYSFLSL